jgi:CheY-like chemotaxis protein
VFAADPKLLQRLEPHIRRVLIMDPHPASARLLGDLMKGLGARDIYFEPEDRRAFDLCKEADPSIIFVEHGGPRLDGEGFVRKLRRSTLACRQAPVVMVTADATALTIKGARDCGVHEFLRKPFTSGDLLKRVAVVFLKPRPWVEAVQYVGPDRRRFNSGEYSGPLKRQSDKGTTKAQAVAAEVDQAMRIVKSAIIHFDSDPNQALRALRQQVATLKAIAIAMGAARLAVAVAGLEVAVNGPAPTRTSLMAPAHALLTLHAEKAAESSAA